MVIYRSQTADGEVRLLVSQLASLSDDLGLRSFEVCAILRLPPGTWPLSPARRSRWRPDVPTETRLRRLVDMLGLVVVLLDSDAPAWLRASNPALFHESPVDVLVRVPEALRTLRDRLRVELAS